MIKFYNSEEELLELFERVWPQAKFLYDNGVFMPQIVNFVCLYAFQHNLQGEDIEELRQISNYLNQHGVFPYHIIDKVNTDISCSEIDAAI